MPVIEVMFYGSGIVAFVTVTVVAVRLFLILNPSIMNVRASLPSLVATVTELLPLVKSLRESSDRLAEIVGRARSIGESAGTVSSAIAGLFKKEGPKAGS